MDTQNTSRQLRYLEEVRIPLQRAGFGTLPVEGEQLPVLWNGAPLCRITGKGSVFYRREDADTPQAEDALFRVEYIAAKTLEYMTAMEALSLIHILIPVCIGRLRPTLSRYRYLPDAIQVNSGRIAQKPIDASVRRVSLRSSRAAAARSSVLSVSRRFSPLFTRKANSPMASVRRRRISRPLPKRSRCCCLLYTSADKAVYCFFLSLQ